MLPTVHEPQVLVGYSYVKKLINLLDHARSSCYISIYIWRLDNQDPKTPIGQLNASIRSASARGVKFYVVANYGLTVSHLRNWQIDAFRYRGSNCFHNKIVVIDGSHVFVGSHNLSNTAFTANVEVSLYICSNSVGSFLIDFIKKQPIYK